MFTWAQVAVEATAVLDPRPCWRCAGSRVIGKEVPLEQEGMQETEQDILTRTALSGTMLPSSHVPLEAAQDEAGRRQPAQTRGEGPGNQTPGLQVHSLNLATFFSLIFLKEEAFSLNMGRKGGGGLFKFLWIYLPYGSSDHASCVL